VEPASALAQDGSEITVTGFGTFTVGDADVTGGGTWTTVAADGVTVTGMGNFLVTRPHSLRTGARQFLAPSTNDR